MSRDLKGKLVYGLADKEDNYGGYLYSAWCRLEDNLILDKEMLPYTQSRFEKEFGVTATFAGVKEYTYPILTIADGKISCDEDDEACIKTDWGHRKIDLSQLAVKPEWEAKLRKAADFLKLDPETYEIGWFIAAVYW